MTATAKWDDLVPRVASAVAMVAVGGAALWAGGAWFVALVIAVTGLMLWELLRLIAPKESGAALQAGLMGAGSLALAIILPDTLLLPLLGATLAVVYGLAAQNTGLAISYTTGLWLAGLGLATLRLEFGLPWVLWLVGIVVATDIAGYFAGRIIGGPKFWPRVSPKKTWSGTAAGWIASAAVSLGFMLWQGLGPEILAMGVVLSFASQLGDVAESALKRHMGVKDSSNLIPGHGGVLDRFDGMMGASLLATMWILLAGAQ